MEQMQKSGINRIFAWLATRPIPRLERWKWKDCILCALCASAVKAINRRGAENAEKIFNWVIIMLDERHRFFWDVSFCTTSVPVHLRLRSYLKLKSIHDGIQPYLSKLRLSIKKR
jgi:hypothetical protein